MRANVAIAEKEGLSRNPERGRERFQTYHERLATVKEQEPGIRENTVFIHPVN